MRAETKTPPVGVGVIDFDLEGESAAAPAQAALAGQQTHAPRVTDIIARDDLIEREASPEPEAPVSDITRGPRTDRCGHSSCVE